MSILAESSRSSFEELVQRLGACLEGDNDHVAVIVLDASQLSRIDARFGQEQRLRMILALGERLRAALRPVDFSLQTGDYGFAIVVPGLKNAGHAMLAARKILRTAEPEDLEPSRDQPAINVRLGMAVYPDDAGEPAEVLRCAQTALEVAKESGESIVVFNNEKVTQAAVGWEIRDDLAEALREGELEVHYQPKLDLATGTVMGSEALVRWFSAKRGPMRPDQFIHVAESSGLIQPLTRFVLNAAMRNLMTWQRDGHDVGVAINVPASMLLDRGLVPMMQNLLSIWDIQPGRLTLELTESAIMTDTKTCFATMSALKEMGARMSIDDFGTGYSSFSYFKTIPADELKIDRAFVKNMTADTADQHIVETIISLAHRFNMKVVAEGIEDQETYVLLQSLGCDVGQGYHIARPMPTTDFETWLDARRYAQPLT